MADSIDPKTLAVSAQEAGKSIDDLGTSLAGAKEKIESLESASKSFYDLVINKSVGLREATKLFYESIDATTEVRKSFGDLTAVTSGLQEKISLMGLAINKAESQLRQSATERAAYNKQLAETTAQIKQLEGAIGNQTIVEQIQKQVDKIEELRKTAEDIKKTDEERAEALRDILYIQEEVKKIEEDNSVVGLARLRIEEEKLKKSIETNEQKEKEAALNLPLLNYENQRLQATQKTNSGLDSILSKLTSGAERSNIFGSAFLAMQTSVDGTKKGISDLITTLGAGLKESLLDPEKSINRVFNLINDKLIKSTLEFDSALAKVGQSTGGFRKEFEGVAMNMGGVSFVALSQYGVTLEKFGQAYQGLSKSIGGFNNMLDSQRKLLTESAASMNMLGVSADTYGKLVGKFMGAIGKTAEGSRDMINDLAKDAIALGKSVGDYTSQFETAMSRISGYGREATRIFKELEAVSAATKGIVASQDLLSISDKFKDFDSAAESVSKLNAILGGTSVNILDMMKADPAEQIMMIKRAAGEAGLEFDKLNIGYKRLLAEYFGGDINKAQAFFNANIAEAQSLMDKAVQSEEELAERKKENIAFQDKLNALIENMKVGLTRVFSILNPIIEGITKFASFPGGAVVATFGMIGTAIALTGKAIDMVTSRIMAKVAAINGSAVASETAASRTAAAQARETAAINQTTQAIQANTAAKQGNAAAGGGGMAGGGAGGGMSGLKTAGLFLGTMAAGAALRAWSTSREEESTIRIEERRKQLKIDEMEAEKRLFGSAITTKNLEAPKADDIFIVNGREYTLNKDDSFYSLNNIVPGAFGFGVKGGPIAEASAAKMDAANAALATNVASKEMAAKGAGASPNMQPPATAGGAQISSNTEKQVTSPVNVNVKAYLQLEGNKVSELAVVLKDHEMTKAV